MNKFKNNYIINFFVASFFASIILFPVVTNAATLKDAFSTSILGNFGTKAGYETQDVSGPENIIGIVILSALSLIGVIFLILMIYGGYLWMTAAGADEKIKKSQSLISSAVIGLVIVVAAYAISSYIMTSLESGTIDEDVGTVENLNE